MSKLLKLSETHYIFVDDSEIREGDCYCFDKVDKQIWFGNFESMEKITHSTKPIERYDHPAGGYEGTFDKIKPLSLSEVEEVINGYSVEKMAEKFVIEKLKISSQAPGVMIGYIDGFKAHQELVKDKLFTVADMINAFVAGTNSGANYESLVDHDSDNNEEAKEFSQNELEEFERSLLPKTEWDVEFDEQGKLRLI